MNYWFYTKWLLFGLYLISVIRNTKFENEILKLLQINPHTTYQDYYKNFKQLRVKYHPDSKGGNENQYHLLNEYNEKYFNDPKIFIKSKNQLYFQSNFFETKLEKFQNNIQQVSQYIMKQIFIFFLICQIDNTLFAIACFILYGFITFFDVGLIQNTLLSLISLRFQFLAQDVFYFESDMFKNYQYMSRNNIIDVIQLIKMLIFFVTIFLYKFLRKDSDNKYQKVFIENLHDLKKLQTENLTAQQMKIRIQNMKNKIYEVLPKPNKCFRIINKIFSFIVLVIFVLQTARSVF